MKKKIVFIASHLSTGGMPQYLVKQIESIKDDMDVYCIEWENVTGGILIVQRNRVLNLLGDKLITLGEDKNQLLNILDNISPDIVHLQEIPELFMSQAVAEKLYSTDRKYLIIETSHDSGFDINNKVHLPDKFLMVSNFQKIKYDTLGIPCEVVEYPIENKVRTKTREQALRDLGLDPNLKHVINVGLFTPRKNQAEIIEYARLLQHYPIQFHFIGNQADNFRYYWEPLMKDFPSNCKWWNERSDVDNFYEAADLFLFTSRGTDTDRETMPLVIRESLSWKVPSLIYNLPVYMGYFDKYDTIEYLTEDLQKNAYRIAEKLLQGTPVIKKKETFIYTMNGPENLEELEYSSNINDTIQKYGDGAGQYQATFLLKELDHQQVKVNPGDVFVDLGGNIGMSSLYASLKGVAEIHAFEPDPKMREILQKNVPSAIVYPYAISNKNEEVELYHWPHNPVYTGPTYKTSTLTLRDVIKKVGKKINYLKIDIEGFEENIFDDLTTEECCQIERMMIEHHNSDTVKVFCDKLRDKGFGIININYGYQSRIYAVYDIFLCELDIKEQKVYYSPQKPITGQVIVSVKDIDSDAVIWSTVYDNIAQYVSYWMVPTPKFVVDFETNMTLGGIKVEFYLNGKIVQTQEFRFRQPTVFKPKLQLKNNVHPNYHNYVEFFVDKIYDKYLEGKTFDTVIDIGANIGLWAEYIQHISNVDKLYLVEPNHEALKILNQSSYPNTTIVNKAVSDVDGEMEFYINHDNSLVSSLTDYGEFHSSYKVQTITFKKLLNDYNISHVGLLKVDIETGEYPLFASLTKDEFDKIDHILMEYHLLGGRTIEKDLTPLIENLKAHGYVVEQHHLHDVGGFIFARKDFEKLTKESPKKYETTVVMYSDKNYEGVAESCIKSLLGKMDGTVRIAYYTIGFKSNLRFPNLYTVEYPAEDKPHMLFYKPQICLDAMDRFPSETYIYADTDILFSKRFRPNELKHSLSYPKASFGPFEGINYWELGPDGNKLFYDEQILMNYFNVTEKTQRYVWACFFVYNNNCRDFFIEYESMCNNKYLWQNIRSYFPMKDETAFNVCLWKRKATENLGFSFVNTHLLETVKQVEENTMEEIRTDRVKDVLGYEWEYVKHSDDVIFYHGFKNATESSEILNYLNKS